MRASIFLIAILFFFSFSGFSQANSIEPIRKYSGSVEYQKTQQNCTILEFNYPYKDLENATEDYVKKMGGRVKSAGKGWNVAKGVKLHKEDMNNYDLYYKVDGKGKGDRATSTMYVIVSEPGENLVATSTNSDARAAVAATAGATAFFSSMGSNVGEYDLAKRISAQEEEIKKAEKKYSSLVDDGKSLESKRSKIDKDIQDNLNAQSKQSQEVDRLKALLEQTKSEKKKDN